MNDSTHPNRDPLPTVLTAEEISLYVHGGSPANTLTEEPRQQMSDVELINFYTDTFAHHKRNHLAPEKWPVLDAQLKDPESWVNRALKMMDVKNKASRNIDWVRLLGRRAEPVDLPSGEQPFRGNPQVAADRAVIVTFIRDAAEDGELSHAIAEHVLAQAGESLSWLDSVPDWLIMSEPIAPFGPSPVERRKLLAEHYPVFSDLIAHQNDAMCSRLAETRPDLVDALRQRVNEARNDPGQNSGRGA